MTRGPLFPALGPLLKHLKADCARRIDHQYQTMDGKPKILFVDDEENIRLMLGMYLKEQGFLVTTAATVAEALKFITQQDFDVLIADLNVGSPGDGFTVVSAMR